MDTSTRQDFKNNFIKQRFFRTPFLIQHLKWLPRGAFSTPAEAYPELLKH